MIGLASCIGCRQPHPGDSTLRDVLVSTLATIEEWQPEHFEAAVAQVETKVDKIRADTGAERWHGPEASRHAAHEAAHAVVGLAYGMRSEGINIDGSLRAHLTGQAPSDGALATMYLAGRCAEQRLSGIRTIQSDKHLAFCLRAAGGSHPGQCDECMTMRVLLRERPDASDADVVERYRELQAETMKFVGRPPIWPAICRTANVLLEYGHLPGELVEFTAGPLVTGVVE